MLTLSLRLLAPTFERRTLYRRAAPRQAESRPRGAAASFGPGAARPSRASPLRGGAASRPVPPGARLEAVEEPRVPDAVLEKLERLPKGPGVYLFLDAKRKPVYIGKARSLRSRVRSYFGRNEDGRVYYPFILKNTADIEWVVTANDKEALLLENNLIKREKPRFNVKLVDDKTYLSIKVSTNEPFPRALLVRRAKRDKALYFGPYGSAAAIRQTLRTVRKFFPLRTCSNAEFRNRTRPCIQYDMGRCGAPCVGLQTEEQYRKVVDEVVLFLKGRTQDLVRALETKMEAEAAALRFESAARLRDQIRWIETSSERQKVVMLDFKDRDIFGEVREGDAVLVEAHFVREGKLVNAHGFTIKSELATDEVLTSFFTQFYSAERFLPDEIVFPIELEERETLEEWLSERKGRRVHIVTPARGAKREWIELARENARQAFRRQAERREANLRALEAIREKLGLARAPAVIECYDISTIMGVFAVGSLVAMKEGELDKSRYRKFKIRTVERQDDFAMMAEVLERRLTAGAKARDLPDLVLLDGGKPQLAAVSRVFARFPEAADVGLAAIAKSRTDDAKKRVIRAAGALGPERVFLAGREEPVLLAEGSPEMLLLQRLRDEAHRFAISYHRELRRARSFKTGLEEIPGIGPKRRKALLEHFGSLRKLREASVADLALCPMIRPAQAEAIHSFFHEGDGASIPDEGREKEEP
jgi:excinuclease ABC subunit C